MSRASLISLLFSPGNDQRVVECSHLRVIGGAQFPSDMEYSSEFRELIEWQVCFIMDSEVVQDTCRSDHMSSHIWFADLIRM